jgi:hypothetical protein
MNENLQRGAKYVTLQKNFSTSQFCYLLFSNPTHKTKTETPYRLWWETTDSNPPGTIKLSSQSTTRVRLCCASANGAKMLGQIHFGEPNWHVLIFFHPILICTVTYEAPGELLLGVVPGCSFFPRLD